MTKVNGIAPKTTHHELTVSCMPEINENSTQSQQLTFLACERIVQREQLELKGLLRNDDDLTGWTGGNNINPLRLALKSVVNPLTTFLDQQDGDFAVSELHFTVEKLVKMLKTNTVNEDLVFGLIGYFGDLSRGVHLHYVSEAIDCCVGQNEIKEKRIWDYENMKVPALI